MPDDYAESFHEEIWGCVNYIKLPYETVMNMPVMDRKNWIQRHNLEQQREREREERKNNGGTSIGGESINAYAKLSQEKIKNNANF